MFATVVLTLALVVASVFIHYEILRWTSNGMENMTIPPRQRLQVFIGIALLAHVLEICMFAVCFWLMQTYWNLGAVVGALEGDWLDFFYFSAASYTTLGMGDLLPTGPMRLVASVESLAGLVLIGWSASFTYLAMRDLWDLHPRRRRGAKSTKK